MDSIEITKEVRRRLNTYNLSRPVLKASNLKKNWQKKIPDTAIRIIVEQTRNIELEQSNNRGKELGLTHSDLISDN